MRRATTGSQQRSRASTAEQRLGSLWRRRRAIVEREFTEVHQIFLKLNDDDVGLSDSLRSLNAHGKFPRVIDRPDHRAGAPWLEQLNMAGQTLLGC